MSRVVVRKPVDIDESASGGGGGEGQLGTEPLFGDDAADSLIWEDDFESYDSVQGGSSPMDANWSVGDASGITLESTAGVGGSQSVKMANGSGTDGAAMDRDISTAPTHFFVEAWAKLDRQGVISGKWFIMTHNAAHKRYQWGVTDFTPPGITEGSPDEGRLTGLQWEDAGGGDLTSSPSDAFDGFVWGGRSDEVAPVLTGDEDISIPGWDPLDDGNFHKFTAEIQTGTGTNAYAKFWLDGILYYDSEGHDASFTGVPDLLKLDFVSGGSNPHDPYDVWWDDIRLWER